MNRFTSCFPSSPPLLLLQGLLITMADFEAAISLVQPSSQREGFATVPNVSWDDVGALHNVRTELEMALLAPIKHR